MGKVLVLKQFDVIVVGSGGGVKLGRPVADLGLRVAYIDKGPLGGTCLNRGCIPSKMLIHVADVAMQARLSHRFFLKMGSDPQVDFSSLVSWVNQTIDQEAQSPVPLYEEHPNLSYYRAEARFVGPKEIQVAGEVITAEKIFLAVGGRSKVPSIPGLEKTPYLTSETCLRNTKKPKKLIVIGGGYIATELGYFHAALGVETHFLVRELMLRGEDKEVQQEFQDAFCEEFSVHLGFVPQEIHHDGRDFHVCSKNKEGQLLDLVADQLLVATGIQPWTDTLGLENTCVELDEKGFIRVDDYLRTTASGIWAFGDCIGRNLFRHTANFEGEYLFRTLFQNPTQEPLHYRPVPHAVFTHPQVAGVGKTQEQLEKEGVDYVCAVNRYADSAMGMALRSHRGFVKLLVCRKSRKLLGAHIVGEEASNMIHTLIAFMNKEATIDDVAGMIYIHPALPEVVRNAARKVIQNLRVDRPKKFEE